MQTTLGGDRLGSGNKQEINLHNYGRSTHDLSYIWRSTMASGTLVPFINEVALPGDSFEIDLDANVMTHPTIGPLFGSYKLQLDVYSIPMRLYQAGLHMNMLGIGMEMEKMKLPLIPLAGRTNNPSVNIDNNQINPSSLPAYLGMRSLGNTGSAIETTRRINAMPYLAYWDIYKQYYANKQEEEGVMIHNDLIPLTEAVDTLVWTTSGGDDFTITAVPMAVNAVVPTSGNNNRLVLTMTGALAEEFDIDRLQIEVTRLTGNYQVRARDLFDNWEFDLVAGTVTGDGLIRNFPTEQNVISINGWLFDYSLIGNIPPKLKRFSLKSIDETKMQILQHPITSPYIVGDELTTDADYPLFLMQHQVTDTDEKRYYAIETSQEGLGIKTYQSDLFNNWLNKEWIEGGSGYAGINEISSIDTTGGSITIDEINLSKKIYDMLNRIAVSGGSYDDWLNATYTHERNKAIENPVYMGGLSKEIVFQEVVSNSATEDQPLGTLAGRGVLSKKHKGGKVKIRVDEPSMIMGIVSITPRLDYSQGNKWSVNLKTMNDFHKPALDGIGFQNLLSESLAGWSSFSVDDNVTSTVVGKQPAWIHYMTNVNQVYGNFADRTKQMYMTLNRRYEVHYPELDENPEIKDLTTYIDPTKFNHIFADTRIDAQNFWVQLKVDMSARRKMSAKVIPNL